MAAAPKAKVQIFAIDTSGTAGPSMMAFTLLRNWLRTLLVWMLMDTPWCMQIEKMVAPGQVTRRGARYGCRMLEQVRQNMLFQPSEAGAAA